MSSQFFRVRPHCPACNHQTNDVIYECDFLHEPVVKFLELKLRPEVIKHYEGASYVLKKCGHCGLVYQEQILTDEGLGLLYDKWLFEGDQESEGGSDVDRFLYYSQELLRIRKFFEKPMKEIRLLDYGMGSGRWCTVAHAMGYQVTGTDISDRLVERSNGLGFSVMALDGLRNQEFDFINTEQVFEHLSEPLAVLLRLKNMLAANGIVKIAVPNGANIERRAAQMDWTVPRGHKNFLIPITPSIHINTYTRDSIVKMGAEAGLKPVDTSVLSEYAILSVLSAKDFIKSMARPIYRRLVKQTYVFLQRD